MNSRETDDENAAIIARISRMVYDEYYLKTISPKRERDKYRAEPYSSRN